MLAEPIAITTAITDALDALNVPYVTVGSLASALHGMVRATMDAEEGVMSWASSKYSLARQMATT